MFYGIIISMFYEIREKHHAPHVHVRYQNYRASIALENGTVLAGELPPRHHVWFRFGWIYIRMSYWPIGNWPR